MNDVFKPRNKDRLNREKYKLDLGSRSLRSYDPKMWNAVPYHIK